MERPTPEEFNRNIENYMYINNDIYRRDYTDPNVLNPVAVQKSLMKSKFGFRESDLEGLPELDGFISVPCHGEDFEPIIDNKWNTYHRVNWNPKEGEWPTIRRLIEHLYGDNGVEKDQTEILYDYHTLLIKEPTRKLWGRVLYSHHQGTGKSSLGLLENLMFGNNFSKVRDTELESTFNGIWATSLIIHLDEPYFEKKKKMSREIRDMITMKTINLRRMQRDFETIPFHAKILITTNDTDFMPFESSDRRYWIREVPPFSDANVDNQFQQKMQEELPHYIHFLLNREMTHREEDKTFYFSSEILKNNGMRKLVNDNLDDDELQLREWFENYFLSDKKRDHVTFIIKDLVRLVDWEKKAPSGKRIGVLLRDGLKLEQPEDPRRLKKGENYIDKSSDAIYMTQRFWTAHRDHFNLNVDIFGETGYL